MKKPIKKNSKSTSRSNRLRKEIPEEFRDQSSNTFEQDQNQTNLNAEEDRGEALIEDRDPIIQLPVHDTEIAPELIQQRAYTLYEQRVASGTQPDPLTDWYEAERLLREETAEKAW